MAWGEQAWAAAARTRHKRKHRAANLARGPDNKSQAGAPDATAARFLSARAPVEDFQYVDDDSDELIVQARKQLLWGHRLTGRAWPFEEIVTRFEWALDTADVNSGRILARHQVARDKARARRERIAAARPKRRKKLKNRTRAERIEDLKQAIGGG